MADANLKNWLVAKRSDEFKVFSHLEWKDLGEAAGWAAVADDLTEQEAIAELIRRAAPEQRAP